MARLTVSILDQESLVPIPSNIIDLNPVVGHSQSSSDASSPPPASSSDKRPHSLHLTPRKFVWGEKVIRNALPRTVIPPCLDPLDVDVDDPTKLPLCWYGAPFYSNMIFAYSQRIRVAVYMKYPNLGLKVGDFDAYGTWPRLVKWFEDQSGLTMHLNKVWGHPTPILTFFNNHEIPRVTVEMWDLIDVMLSEIGYPADCELKWYLDRRLEY